MARKIFMINNTWIKQDLLTIHTYGAVYTALAPTKEEALQLYYAAYGPILVGYRETVEPHIVDRTDDMFKFIEVIKDETRPVPTQTQIDDWEQQIADGYTRLGLYDWVLNQMEMNDDLSD